AAIAFAALLLGACAQQKAPGYYATEHDTTATDARDQALGRERAQAPAQIQFGFGNTQKSKPANSNAAAEAPAAPEAATANPRALTEAKTFLGTVPCVGNANACSANRITLTLAPTGEWRARTVSLNTMPDAETATTEQGCWNVIGTQPLRIALQLKNNNVKASLTFLSDNVLRINSLDGVAPNLDYRLTRQADIDAINELSKHAPLQCAR
ncbi:MAG: hypothetical protein ABI228_00455, partial [Burkholderiaceae bacterium]